MNVLNVLWPRINAPFLLGILKFFDFLGLAKRLQRLQLVNPKWKFWTVSPTISRSTATTTARFCVGFSRVRCTTEQCDFATRKQFTDSLYSNRKSWTEWFGRPKIEGVELVFNAPMGFSAVRWRLSQKMRNLTLKEMLPWRITRKHNAWK